MWKTAYFDWLPNFVEHSVQRIHCYQLVDSQVHALNTRRNLMVGMEAMNEYLLTVAETQTWHLTPVTSHNRELSAQSPRQSGKSLACRYPHFSMHLVWPNTGPLHTVARRPLWPAASPLAWCLMLNHKKRWWHHGTNAGMVVNNTDCQEKQCLEADTGSTVERYRLWHIWR